MLKKHTYIWKLIIKALVVQCWDFVIPKRFDTEKIHKANSKSESCKTGIQMQNLFKIMRVPSNLHCNPSKKNLIKRKKSVPTKNQIKNINKIIFNYVN